MKTNNWLSLVALAALAVGCDPYSSTTGGTPNIVGVTATYMSAGSTVTTPVEATDVSGVWTFSGATAITCGDPTIPTPVGFFDQQQIFITFDRQVNGGLVQASPTDCTPAGNWVTITPNPSAGNAWYTCYSPSSPKASEGGSVVVYQAPTGGSVGWQDSVFINGAVALHITGTVAGRVIDVTTNACP